MTHNWCSVVVVFDRHMMVMGKAHVIRLQDLKEGLMMPQKIRSRLEYHQEKADLVVVEFVVALDQRPTVVVEHLQSTFQMGSLVEALGSVQDELDRLCASDDLELQDESLQHN